MAFLFNKLVGSAQNPGKDDSEKQNQEQQVPLPLSQPTVEKKEKLEEVQLFELGVKLPDTFTTNINRQKFSTINSLAIPENIGCPISITFFTYIIERIASHNRGCANDAEDSMEYYNVANALLMSRHFKDKIGLDINKANGDGTSPCKVLIGRISGRRYPQTGVLNLLTKLMQKLLDAEPNLSTDKDQEASVMASAQPGKVSEARQKLNQTPLDYAFEVCPSELRLDYDNCTWQGFPDRPPTVSSPIKMLLKAIYLKVNKDSMQSLAPFKVRLYSSLEACGFSLASPLIDIISEYSREPAIFRFTCRTDDIGALLRLGRLFVEYDEAIERKQNGEQVSVAKQSKDLNALVFKEEASAHPSASAQSNNQVQIYQDQAAIQFRNVAGQLAAVKAEQASMRQELSDQRKLFTEAFRQTNDQLQKLLEITQALALGASQNKRLEQ